MNFTATAKFNGLNISVVEQTTRATLRLSVEQSASIVLQEALYIVPLDTGDLALSGHVEIEQAGTKATGYVVFDSRHAGVVEYGTGVAGAASPDPGPYKYDPNWPGMPSQPYIRPALDTARPAIAEIFRDNTLSATRLLNGK